MYSINKVKPGKVRRYMIYPVAEGVFLAALALLLTAITAFFIYHHAMKAIEVEIKDGLLRTAAGIAACMDGDELATFDSPEKKDLSAYQKTIKFLQKARIATKHCTYLYVNRMVGDKVFFVVDPTPIDENGKPLFSDEKNLEPSVPMTPYPDASQELIKALTEKKSVVSAEPYTDEWGTFYSAFIPIYDKNKKMVGTLGADLKINDMIARLEPIVDATKRAFFVSVILAMLCGTLIWFTRRFSLQLNESRISIMDSLIDAKDFAEQSSARLGTQLQRIGHIFKNISDRLTHILEEKNDDNRLEALAKEEERLRIFSDKLIEAGDLKISRREVSLGDFKILEVEKNIKKHLHEVDLESDRINFEVDSNIPETLYGAIQTYEELLGQMSFFFIKMFEDKISCKIAMTSEETHEVLLTHTMSAGITDLDESRVKLLKYLSQEAEKEDFFAELELAEAVSVSIVRELVFLFNSDISVELKENQFVISFETRVQKALEQEDEEE